MSFTCRLIAPAAVSFALVAFMPGVSGAAPVEPEAPLHAWLFDGGTTAAAFFGPHNGVLEGDAQFDAAEAPVAYSGNQSLLLDGTGDYVDVPGMIDQLGGLEAITMSFWVKADSTGVERGFFKAQSGTGGDNYSARYDVRGWSSGDGQDTNRLKIALDIDSAGTRQFESDQNLQSTDWSHVAYTWESGQGFKLYIDGVEDTNPGASNFGTATGTLDENPAFRIGLGSKDNPSNDGWQGRIDEVGVWDRALSGDEVAWLAGNSIRSTRLPAYDQVVRDDNPILYWRLDETSGTTAFDSSGNGHDGTHVGDVGTGNLPGAVLREPGNASYYFAGDSDGSGDYVEDTNAPAYLDGLTAMSIEVWVKSDLLDVDRGIFSTTSTPSGHDDVLSMRYDQQGANTGRDSLLKFAIRDDTGDNQAAETANFTQSTEWQHLVMLWEQGEDPQLYINGLLDEELQVSGGELSGVIDVETLRLGWNQKSPNDWEGGIDEFAIYDRVLSPEEIWQHYQAATVPEPSSIGLCLLGAIALLFGRRKR